MNRQSVLLAALAIVVCCLPALGQTLEVPPSTPLGQPIIAKVEIGEGGKVAWKADAGSSVINAGKGRAYIWATPGTHSIQAVVASGGDAELLWLESPYVVGDAPPTPPPVVKTLAELAGNKAGVIAEALGDLQANLAAFANMGQVERFVDLVFVGAAVNLPVDHPAATAIKSRLAAAASGELTDASRKSLDAALAKAIAELGSKPPGPTPPPVPPVVEGKRLVVVLHEVDDNSAAFANLRVNTANNSAAARYFREKGHTVQFLEEEQKDQSGQPYPLVEKLKALGVGVPAVFVLDPTTQAVLYQTKLTPDATADNLVEYAKRGGG